MPSKVVRHVDGQGGSRRHSTSLKLISLLKLTRILKISLLHLEVVLMPPAVSSPLPLLSCAKKKRLSKVIMQVDGKAGMDVMRKRVALRGPLAAYDGALAFAGGSLMGHYPW